MVEIAYEQGARRGYQQALDDVRDRLVDIDAQWTTEPRSSYEARVRARVAEFEAAAAAFHRKLGDEAARNVAHDERVLRAAGVRPTAGRRAAA
jgi:hypothetical protein